jgi:hypothetical protein
MSNEIYKIGDGQHTDNAPGYCDKYGIEYGEKGGKSYSDNYEEWKKLHNDWKNRINCYRRYRSMGDYTPKFTIGWRWNNWSHSATDDCVACATRKPGTGGWNIDTSNHNHQQTVLNREGAVCFVSPDTQSLPNYHTYKANSGTNSGFVSIPPRLHHICDKDSSQKAIEEKEYISMEPKFDYDTYCNKDDNMIKQECRDECVAGNRKAWCDRTVAAYCKKHPDEKDYCGCINIDSKYFKSPYDKLSLKTECNIPSCSTNPKAYKTEQMLKSATCPDIQVCWQEIGVNESDVSKLDIQNFKPSCSLVSNDKKSQKETVEEVLKEKEEEEDNNMLIIAGVVIGIICFIMIIIVIIVMSQKKN